MDDDAGGQAFGFDQHPADQRGPDDGSQPIGRLVRQGKKRDRGREGPAAPLADGGQPKVPVGIRHSSPKEAAPEEFLENGHGNRHPQKTHGDAPVKNRGGFLPDGRVEAITRPGREA